MDNVPMIIGGVVIVISFSSIFIYLLKYLNRLPEE